MISNAIKQEYVPQAETDKKVFWIVELSGAEAKAIDRIIKANGMSRADFLRQSANELILRSIYK